MRIVGMVAVASLCALVALPVSAQTQKTVNGLVVNIGIMSAIDAEHTDAQHGVHKGGHGSGTQHILVSLAEEKGGSRVGDAQVSIEVKNPKGVVQKKALMPMVTAGYPDYSEVFDFPWSGKYQLRVLIQRKGGAKPVETTFTVNHVI
ncbi:MAG TPA: hypothetical protein VKE95_04800 [Burkholderiales bacterium]|nr:hypothetical protein [Burkholderiales bacterium]